MGSNRQVRGLLAALLLAAGCGAAAGLPPGAPQCPEAPPVIASAAASAPPHASAAASAPPPEGSDKLLWSQLVEDGDVHLQAHPEGVAVIPVFLRGTGRGSQVAVLDRAGVARWERSGGGLGAASAAVAPDGSIVSIAVNALDWPKTPEPFDQREVVTMAPDGKRVASFRLPAALSGEQIQVDSAGQLIITGAFTKTQRLAPDLLLEGEAGKSRGFVARYSPRGQPRWARSFAGPVSAWPAPNQGILLLQSAEEGAPVQDQRLLLVNEKGQETWSIAIPEVCQLESIKMSAGPVFSVIAPPGCLASSPPPPATAKSCALYRIDSATGKSTASLPLPGCLVAADAQGIAVLSEKQLSLLDAAGQPRWSTSIPVPRPCFMRGFELSSVVLDAASIYVAGSCPGQRVGTTMNSPYAIASDTALTYLARYDRR